MSFWSKGIPKDVKPFASYDHQLHRKPKINDRVPIEEVGRPELLFEIVNADVSEPVERKTSKGHQ